MCRHCGKKKKNEEGKKKKRFSEARRPIFQSRALVCANWTGRRRYFVLARYSTAGMYFPVHNVAFVVYRWWRLEYIDVTIYVRSMGCWLPVICPTDACSFPLGIMGFLGIICRESTMYLPAVTSYTSRRQDKTLTRYNMPRRTLWFDCLPYSHGYLLVLTWLAYQKGRRRNLMFGLFGVTFCLCFEFHVLSEYWRKQGPQLLVGGCISNVPTSLLAITRLSLGAGVDLSYVPR